MALAFVIYLPHTICLQPLWLNSNDIANIMLKYFILKFCQI